MDLTRGVPRSALETFAGVVMAPRTTDKCRAHLQGTLGEYIYNCGLDRQLFKFLGTDADEFAAVVRAAPDDSAVEAFVRQKVSDKSPEEIEAWKRDFLNYEPDLSRPNYSGQLAAMQRRAPERRDITLWVHLTDIEEGRPVPSEEEVRAFKARLQEAQPARTAQ
jgi:hypothetical protein